MSWLPYLFIVLLASLVWWAMWREDFDGIKTERQIRNRTRLSFDEFYASYYRETGICPDLIRRILNVTSRQLGIPSGCIRPNDNLLQANLGDTIYYIVELAEEFELNESRKTELADLDGTLDNIVRYISTQNRKTGITTRCTEDA